VDLKETGTALSLLFMAAVLEAGGDAVIRTGLNSSNSSLKRILFAVAALILFAYGYVVNAPSWDFGRLLGIYIVFFFLVAQILSWAVFHQQPSRAILFGGTLIVAGGIIISINPRVCSKVVILILRGPHKGLEKRLVLRSFRGNAESKIQVLETLSCPRQMAVECGSASSNRATRPPSADQSSPPRASRP
jgi:small multidrug resistance family-3 protein